MSKNKIFIFANMLIFSIFIMSCSSQEYTTAKLAIQQSDFSKASEWLPKAMEVEPDNPEIPMVMAIEIHAQNEDWNEIWNVGNEKNEKSIRYLAEKVIEFTNSSSKIVIIDPVNLHGKLFAEAPEKIPDSSKIRDRLNWDTIKSADEVIKEVVDHFKEIKGI